MSTRDEKLRELRLHAIQMMANPFEGFCSVCTMPGGYPCVFNLIDPEGVEKSILTNLCPNCLLVRNTYYDEIDYLVFLEHCRFLCRNGKEGSIKHLNYSIIELAKKRSPPGNPNDIISINDIKF